MKKNKILSLLYRIEKTLIFLSHFILLGWMIYLLRQSGQWETLTVFIHFFFLSCFGAFLIYYAAGSGRRERIRELRGSNES